MGVKTKEFGKFGWVVLESFARAFDEFRPKSKCEYERVKCLLSHIFYLLGFILPCVYCRVSFRDFTDGKNPQTDICKMINKRKARLLIYNIHECVNDKLQMQGNIRNRISFEDVKFTHIETFKFWESFLILCGYIMCDYRVIEHDKILQFFISISDFLEIVSPDLSAVFKMGFNNMTQDWKILKNRLDDVWNLVLPLEMKNDWKFEFSQSRFREICKSGIVAKCVK